MKKLKVYAELKESEFNAVFIAIEHEPSKIHYGNGIYITILRNGRQWQYIDHRYIKYNGLREFLTNYLKAYFGENLLKITEIE